MAFNLFCRVMDLGAGREEFCCRDRDFNFERPSGLRFQESQESQESLTLD